MAKISNLMDQKVIIVAEDFKFWTQFASENHISRATRFLNSQVCRWMKLSFSLRGQLESFHCLFLKIALLILALYKYYYFLISVLFFFSGKIIKGSNFDKGGWIHLNGSWLWFSRGSALMFFAHIMLESMKYTKTTASSNSVQVQFH